MFYSIGRKFTKTSVKLSVRVGDCTIHKLSLMYSRELEVNGLVGHAMVSRGNGGTEIVDCPYLALLEGSSGELMGWRAVCPSVCPFFHEYFKLLL